MQILTTAGLSKTSFITELTKPIHAFIFLCSLKINQLTTETINIRISRNNSKGTLLITEQDVPLAQFILAATMLKNSIGYSVKPAMATCAIVDLTTGGNIQLFDNDVIRFELKGLKATETYDLRGLQSAYNATHAHVYVKKIAPKDSENPEFDVLDFDMAVLEDTLDMSEITLVHNDGTMIAKNIDNFRNELNQTFNVAQILNDGSVDQIFTNQIQIPLLGARKVIIKKNAGKSANLLLRKNYME